MTEGEIHDLAYMEACEQDSPNSPDFDRLFDKIYERICEEQALNKE